MGEMVSIERFINVVVLKRGKSPIIRPLLDSEKQGTNLVVKVGRTDDESGIIFTDSG